MYCNAQSKMPHWCLRNIKLIKVKLKFTLAFIFGSICVLCVNKVKQHSVLCAIFALMSHKPRVRDWHWIGYLGDCGTVPILILESSFLYSAKAWRNERLSKIPLQDRFWLVLKTIQMAGSKIPRSSLVIIHQSRPQNPRYPCPAERSPGYWGHE